MFRKYTSHFIHVHLEAGDFELRHVVLNKTPKLTTLDENQAKEWIIQRLTPLSKVYISNSIYSNLKMKIGDIPCKFETMTILNRRSAIRDLYLQRLPSEPLDIRDLAILTMILGGASISDGSGNIRLVTPIKI